MREAPWKHSATIGPCGSQAVSGAAYSVDSITLLSEGPWDNYAKAVGVTLAGDRSLFQWMTVVCVMYRETKKSYGAGVECGRDL